MTLVSLVRALPKDPNNPAYVLGWAVIRRTPWRFVDIFASKDLADAQAATLGSGYESRYGSHKPGSSEFKPK
ncbi:hypothetical protein [Pseudomonas huanghezhanensis]|uniref:hypothetical protein n=1 Tax=Pseudomonas huanghezhanensis TaxID=3002903 RepID=UPI0022854870|nr:hypothetical protein [Pseudomonas sp. BSw22131]